MLQPQTTPTAHRGRLFPERQLSETEIVQREADRANFRQRCQLIFDRVQPDLLQTHYNWYLAVEPESGEYFIDRDEIAVAQIAHQKHPNAPLHVFRINQTGVCGTL